MENQKNNFPISSKGWKKITIQNKDGNPKSEKLGDKSKSSTNRGKPKP